MVCEQCIVVNVMQRAGIGPGADNRRVGPGCVMAPELVHVLRFNFVLVHARRYAGYRAPVGTDCDFRGLAHSGNLRPALIQAHVMQYVIERNEFVRRMNAGCLTRPQPF